MCVLIKYFHLRQMPYSHVQIHINKKIVRTIWVYSVRHKYHCGRWPWKAHWLPYTHRRSVMSYLCPGSCITICRKMHLWLYYNKKLNRSCRCKNGNVMTISGITTKVSFVAKNNISVVALLHCTAHI